MITREDLPKLAPRASDLSKHTELKLPWEPRGRRSGRDENHSKIGTGKSIHEQVKAQQFLTDLSDLCTEDNGVSGEGSIGWDVEGTDWGGAGEESPWMEAGGCTGGKTRTFSYQRKNSTFKKQMNTKNLDRSIIALMTNSKQTQRAQQTNHNSKQLHAKGTENARVQRKICNF